MRALYAAADRVLEKIHEKHQQALEAIVSPARHTRPLAAALVLLMGRERCLAALRRPGGVDSEIEYWARVARLQQPGWVNGHAGPREPICYT